MIQNLESEFLSFLIILNQILTAGVSITAFALLLYSLTFNLSDRVARTFSLILFSVVIVFTSEVIGSISSTQWEIEFWLRFEWVGIILLPAFYLHFSDSLLTTTGKPSRGRRTMVVRATYVASILFLISLPTNYFIGPVVLGKLPAPHLETTIVTTLFTTFYILIMGLSWFNFARSYNRTTTATSRRRMFYLITGAIAPAIGSFQFLLFGSDLASNHAYSFWILAALSNIFVGTFIIIMAYAVSFFGVTWPDRVVKRRLLKWILRGPITASIVLGITILVNRLSVFITGSETRFTPIFTVGAIIICQYLITVLSPIIERVLSNNTNGNELELIRRLEASLITRNDLNQYMEMLLSVVMDRTQSKGAYMVELNSDDNGVIITSGKTNFDDERTSDDLKKSVADNGKDLNIFQWGEDYVIPINDESSEQAELLGLLGVVDGINLNLDEEQQTALEALSLKAAYALNNRKIQSKLFKSLQTITPDVDQIQKMRAAGSYDSSSLLSDETQVQSNDISEWVKEALSHYWGGPKLTKSPLLKLKVVRDVLDHRSGSDINALRYILKKAIEKVKPEGERRFTGEWILYNILEMKFLEGRKVREVALKLSVSEADLYRKQKVAIEEVSKIILEMEGNARQEV